MIIEIEDEAYHEILKLLEARSKKLHNKLLEAKTVKVNNSIEEARRVKTEKIKDRIAEAIKTLKNNEDKVNRYNINKLTKISYQTLKKYSQEFNI